MVATYLNTYLNISKVTAVLRCVHRLRVPSLTTSGQETSSLRRQDDVNIRLTVDGGTMGHTSSKTMHLLGRRVGNNNLCHWQQL